MTMIFDQSEVFGKLIIERARRTGRSLRPDLLWVRFFRNPPKRLILTLRDLRVADPTLAQEFYNGIYSFAGYRVNTGGNNPFGLHAPQLNISEGWKRELHSFRWLRHLHSSQNLISNSHAQSLIRDWMADYARPRKNIAWKTEVAAQRLISWLSHSMIIADQSDTKLYNDFLKCIGTHIRFLRRYAIIELDELPGLQACMALAYGALCVQLQRPGSVSTQKIHEELGKILERQILPDGGHVSRCSAVLPEILMDLLPLDEACRRLGITPSKGMLTAIDRMMPAIRYYRHEDGSLARFNGTSASQQDIIATVLRYDDTKGKPAREAPQSAYQRLSAKHTTIIMDTGKPAEGKNAVMARAGCLSFEMSSLRSCFIVNCGSPVQMDNETHVMASRSTAAHSTATLHNTSSCQFYKGKMLRDYPGSRLIKGPEQVICRREMSDEHIRVTARHDGYLRQFGVWHERTLQLSDDGKWLLGQDRFFGDNGKFPLTMNNRDDCAVRFHLHPMVKAEIDENSQNVIMHVDEKQLWRFSCNDALPGLEESIFFASPRGPQPTLQIVINMKLLRLNRINWRFERIINNG